MNAAATRLLIGAGVGAVVLAAMAISRGKLNTALGNVALGAAHAVNPFNQENVFYTGVNALGARASGDKDWNLGARLWETLNPQQSALERAIVGETSLVTGSPAYTSSMIFPADIEDADMGFYMGAETPGGASLNYRHLWGR